MKHAVTTRLDTDKNNIHEESVVVCEKVKQDQEHRHQHQETGDRSCSVSMNLPNMHPRESAVVVTVCFCGIVQT